MVASRPESHAEAEELSVNAADSLSYIYLMARELAPMARDAGAEALAARLEEAAQMAADALAARSRF
ncbi:MAG: hypothetical protein HXY28_11350 [Hydrogenophilaceae bacterium]|jgi:hypothetical protein|nr:hypothetical protein [Hydrogenophilaceae bacterium]